MVGDKIIFMKKIDEIIEKLREEETRIAQAKKIHQDYEAPIIDIAEAITVNSAHYEFQGKVTDQSKTIYVEVDGRRTDVKNGKFIVKGYSTIDKQISIEASDEWGNRSEPKIVKLTIDIKDTRTILEKILLIKNKEGKIIKENFPYFTFIFFALLGLSHFTGQDWILMAPICILLILFNIYFFQLVYKERNDPEAKTFGNYLFKTIGFLFFFYLWIMAIAYLIWW